MLLWEDAERFRELSGEDPEETSIARISGFLDGYEKGKACTQSCTESQCESVQEIEGEQMDRYGYIGIETLLNFCENSKDHAITPNDFMRMKRVRMPSAEPEEVIPHRNYKYLSDYWCKCGWHLGKKGDVKYCAECGRKVKWDG